MTRLALAFGILLASAGCADNLVSSCETKNCTDGDTTKTYQVCASAGVTGSSATYKDSSGNTICSISNSSTTDAQACSNKLLTYCGVSLDMGH